MSTAENRNLGRLATAAPKFRVNDASLAGKIAYACLPLRQNIVLSNLQLAFGESLNDAEIRHLARAFYSHLLRSLWEFGTASFSRATPVRVENPEIAFEALQARSGLLLMAGHTGSWGVTLETAIRQYPEFRDRISVLVRQFRPAWLRSIFVARLKRAGINVLAKRRSMNSILQRLAENQVVGFVMDQHASPREAVRVNFFGRPAWTFRSLAVVARRSGAPVVPAAVYREQGCHVFRLEPPLMQVVTNDFEHDIRVNTQQYNHALERIIQRHPEQWIWNHRRWKEG